MDALEEISREHANIVKRLDRLVEELSLQPSNIDLQKTVMYYLKKLRKLRSKLIKLAKSALASGDIDPSFSEIRFVVGTLSEYFVIVALELEEELLYKLKTIMNRKKEVFIEDLGDINTDLQELSLLKELLQLFVGKYY